MPYKRLPYQSRASDPLWLVTSKHHRVDTLTKCLIKDSHIKVEPLIHSGPDFSILGVHLVILPILIDEVGSDSPGLIHHELPVYHGGDVVHGIDSQEFWLHVLSSHQVQHLEVVLHTKTLRSHGDNPARGREGHAVHVNRSHLGM